MPRDGILSVYIFNSLQKIKDLTENWITFYNGEKPHDNLNDMTPIKYKNAT